MNVSIIIAILIISCAVNVVFLEAIVKIAPESGNLITFSQFVFVSLEGFVFTTSLCRRPSVIPLQKYAVVVILFFAISLANNYALNFNISVPLHIVFRSGSLLANMMLGVLLLRRNYSPLKYLSVLIITLGIIMATLSSSPSRPPTAVDDRHESVNYSTFDFAIGISLLTFALLASALCGIFQEQLFLKYGKHAKEALFYTHALSLPGFLFLLPDIYRQIVTFNASEPLPTPLEIPRLWLYLMLNACTQFCCIMSVHVLMTRCTSLTVTLVITVRKFVSLVFSIYYFDNEFTTCHWIGTALVFGGTLLFMDLRIANNLVKPLLRLLGPKFRVKSD